MTKQTHATAANPIRDAAYRYIDAGYRVLPANARRKFPTLKSYKQYRNKPPSEKQNERWFLSANAVCILTGEVSGSLEVLDFDQGGRAFDAWCDLVEEHDPRLLQRLVVQKSRSGGRHVFFRNELITPKSNVHARTVTPDVKDKTVLIETLGEGSLVMCDPSPGYVVLQGDLTNLPVMSIDERAILVDAAAAFNEVNSSVENAPTTKTTSDGTQPGDDFSERGDVATILTKHGWRLLHDGNNQQWCRPGKATGCSATLKDGVFYVFSSNASPFEPNKSYSRFAVYAFLEHGGDFSAATRQLASEGYGKAEDNDVNLSSFLDGLSGETKAKPPAEPELPDPGPVPESLLQVPGFISNVMSHCLDTAPYPNATLAFAGAIALLATLAGRKVRDPGDNRTNLYLLGLAHSAAGKDWPRKLNVQILHQVGLADCIGERFASGEGIQDALHLTPSMLFQTDEVDGMLQSIKKSNDARYENVLSTLLTMYSSANTVYPMRRKAGKKSPGTIDQPSLVVFGTAIPNHYYAALSERMLTNGFFARMMILECGQRGEGQEPKIAEVPNAIIDVAKWWADYQPGGGNLGTWHPRPRIVPHDDAAKGILIEARLHAEREYAKAERKNDSVGTTVWGRVNEQTRKLALLYAISVNHESPLIDEPAVKWAMTLVDHLTQRMLFMASSHVAESPFATDCLKVFAKIRKEDNLKIGHSKLLKAMAMEAVLFKKLIATLVERGDIIAEQETTAGRTGTLYRLNRVQQD
ncbi:bifunctional DNA primase/polymerase [Neorhodopirellula pilleata]|uniref:DNA primase/polymerase bifunctional N-terminal domain-containing protein n=1 Tax=Neorhodopirellula pilleata TaxID=2714738 RepID=A0A5C6AR92_9BACT|nr:bifunctional DNA primase/polymerase [Neorhodopirellula pilleata]TWU01749.1 hypothetical protein Pla100_14840 [Neorhodopirellula pilleata]